MTDDEPSRRFVFAAGDDLVAVPSGGLRVAFPPHGITATRLKTVCFKFHG